MLKDVLVSIDSWEYPIDFMVLQTKFWLVGYMLILSRPSLEIIDASISHRLGDMTM
jgi:hypothetical protein